MERLLTRFAILLLLCIAWQNAALASGDTVTAKTNLPLSYFQFKAIEGSSVMKVDAVDVGTNSIKFTNPYNTSATFTTWAGYFRGSIDGNAAKFYCIDISHNVAFYTSGQPHTYTDNGATPATITYILNNYYPYKSLPYTGSLSASEEAASVQVAIWHYADGVDVNTVQNTTIKNRALQIVADVDANSANTVQLTTFAILPNNQTVAANANGVIFVKALDANNNGVANLSVNLATSSGSLSASAVSTNVSGVTPNVTVTKGSASQATITATTSFIIPQGTKYEHSSGPNSYQKLVLATPTTANRQAQATVNWSSSNPNCSLTGYTTYTQGGWGSPGNSTPGGLRDAKFSTVFPSGMVLGGTKTATFTTAYALKSFLPAGGTASSYTTNYTNPTSTSAGVFGGQLAALAMNVYFSDAGFLGSNTIKLGQLVITTGPLAGKTVYDLLGYANTAIGGGSTPYTIAQLNTAADNVNNNFDNGTQDQNFLTCPSVQPASIGDIVWNDANKNGVQDNGENGMANVTVKLYDCNNNLIATTTTDASGIYSFTNVTPGSYYIQVTLPANYAFTSQNSGSDDSKDSDVDVVTGKTACTAVTSGSINLTWDAGVYYNKASVGDKVWNDVDADGVQDNNASETGISNVTVQLYDCNNTLVATTTTDGNGNYLFSNLTPGSFYVKVTLPSGFTFSPKNQGGNSATDSDVDPANGKTVCFTLAAGETNLTYDCGLFSSRVSIGDFVWKDNNKNGVQDSGEPGIGNVTVKLYDCSNNLIATTTTDSTGLYSFTNIVSGSYYVQVTLPTDYNFTLKNQGSDAGKDSDVDPANGKTACTALTPGQTNLTLDAGVYFNKGSLGDKVWLDANENGVQDNGEAGISGVTVKLHDCSNNNVLDTTTTNASGNYLFSNLAAGSYYVAFTAPAGYKVTAKLQGSDVSKDSDADPVTGKTACVTLAAGDNNLTVDAGMYVSKVSVGDFVWKDTNQNGVQDSGEPGMAGVVVKLYDCNDNFIATATTDSLGAYHFNNLPAGSYYVQFIQPLGYSFSAKLQGGDVSKDSDADPLTGKTACTAVTAGTTNNTLDAGLYQPKASVGNKVWNDLNRDGVQDNPVSEIGIGNVVVKLYNCSGTLVSTTTTDANGDYLFSNLTPGDYYIKFVTVSGFAISAKNNIADSTIDSDADPVSGMTSCFTLAPGANDLTRDCGMYLNKVSVGDFVWKDINFNGIQDNGETGLGSVTVRLFDCSNNVIATTVTNSNGYYTFQNLVPGGYYVQFFLPSGYTFSPKMQGSNVAVDSDPDATTGKTSCVTLTPGTNVITWDAGMYETVSTFADISVTKSCDRINTFNNETVVYTIVVTNNGPQSASGITVSDNLPEGLIYLSSTPFGAYDTATGIWTVGTLASGASATLTVTMKVDVTDMNNSVVDLGPAKEFNMFVLEDMTVPSSDTQGKLAVGRDASLQGYSVGDQLPNSNGTEDVLVVGRDLTFLTGRVYNGNVVYGNSTNLPRYSVSIDEGTLRQDTVIDFAAAATYLRNLSTQLSAQIVNGTTTYQPFNEVTMVGTDPFINVFLVDGAKLSTANNTAITVPNGSVVLVNVYGSNVSWGYGFVVNGTARNNTLFNFYEADSLYIHGIDVTGSILAPRAHVYFQAGVQHGQMICRSYRGQGQLNLDPFVGNLPVSKDIVNIAELKTSNRYDPDSAPGNGISTEDDYSAHTLHVGVVNNNNPNWRVVGNINNNNNALVMVNNGAGKVYAGTSTGSIIASNDNGGTWTNITANLSVSTVRSIAVGTSSKSNRILAGTAEGIYASNNEGATWDSTNVRMKDIRSIVAVADAMGRIYAGAWDGGVYVSIDNGNNWTPMNNGLTNLKVNAIHVTNNGDVLAATFGAGIFKYSVLNSRWIPVSIDYPYIWNLNAGSNGILYAATYGGGIYRSVDGGDNWSKMNTGLNNLYIYSVTQDTANNLIATSWSGGVTTMDHGTTEWRSLGLDGAGISTVLVNSVSGTVLVSAKDGSIYAKNGTLAVSGGETVPVEFALSQNYPNPFNPSTKINFSLPAAGHVSLVVYNILGQQVAKLVDAEFTPGNHTVQFDGRNMASGIYIYRLTAAKQTITKKMMLIK